MYPKIETDNQLDELVELVKEIWTGHFGPMFDCPEKLEYVIEQIQSKKAVLEQIEDGYVYYFIQNGSRAVGYFAYKTDTEQNEMFLSKIYLLSDQRGKGQGRKVLNYLENICRARNISKIRLWVLDKNTSSIRVYEKWGFKKVGELKRDFRNDIKCNDFIMEKEING